MERNQSIDMPSLNETNPAMTVRSLSFHDFLELNQTSTRLNNSINSCINEGNFPFQTIGDYLDAGESGAGQLMRIQNFGKKTLEELDHLISVALDASEANAQVTNAQDECESASVRALNFLELLDRCHASVRLRNGITKGISDGLFPYGSVGEYIDGGKKAAALLLSLPNIGKGAAKELQDFIENAIGKRHELADRLESAYPMVFDDLLETYRLTPDTEPLTFHSIEKQIQQLLDSPRDAEVCLRRFHGDTLESIAMNIRVTRERVRQIAKKYDSIITNIYTQAWTKKAITHLQSLQDAPNKLPSNDAISDYHRNFPAALRQVYLPESGRHGPLLSQERYQLAEKLGADTEAELKELRHWTLERLL
ncbi:MAG TPA: hypothetical protein VGE50_12320, partial [Gammaproteobacteria bacterium]